MVNKKVSTRFFSKQQESGVAKMIGGKTTANSGARPYQKGDISKAADFSDPENYQAQESWLIEAKTCMEPKKSFSIKKEWLEKLKEEQYACNKNYSALCFDFGDQKSRYYIVDENTFKNLFLK